jgi:hypothetical protein
VTVEYDSKEYYSYDSKFSELILNNQLNARFNNQVIHKFEKLHNDEYVEIKDDDEYYDEDEHTQEHTGFDKLGDAHAGEDGHQHVSSSSENDEEGAEILVGADSAL